MTRTRLALVLGLMMPTVAAADPVMLGDAQLDTVTAAGILVDVASIASAFGDLTLTDTDADTFVNGAEGFGIGLTVGEAFACCGPGVQVEVGSQVLGIGDLVHGTTHSVEHEGTFLAYGFSVGILLALSFEQPLQVYQQAIEAFHDGLTDLRHQLDDSLAGSLGIDNTFLVDISQKPASPK